MNKDLIHIQLLFVVESNAIIRSDSAYFSWLLRKTYANHLSSEKCNGVLFSYDFVYMDGKAKYKSKHVISEINSQKRLSQLDKTYVVYCIDIDTKGKEDAILLDEIQSFCDDKGYYLIVSYREIEDVVKSYKGGSKSERVKYFVSHNPKYESVKQADLMVDLRKIKDKVGTSNFNLVINKIVSNAQNIRSKRYESKWFRNNHPKGNKTVSSFFGYTARFFRVFLSSIKYKVLKSLNR